MAARIPAYDPFRTGVIHSVRQSDQLPLGREQQAPAGAWQSDLGKILGHVRFGTASLPRWENRFMAESRLHHHVN